MSFNSSIRSLTPSMTSCFLAQVDVVGFLRGESKFLAAPLALATPGGCTASRDPSSVMLKSRSVCRESVRLPTASGDLCTSQHEACRMGNLVGPAMWGPPYRRHMQ